MPGEGGFDSRRGHQYRPGLPPRARPTESAVEQAARPSGPAPTTVRPCPRSSVGERLLGKKKVVSSILTGGSLQAEHTDYRTGALCWMRQGIAPHVEAGNHEGP